MSFLFKLNEFRGALFALLAFAFVFSSCASANLKKKDAEDFEQNSPQVKQETDGRDGGDELFLPERFEELSNGNSAASFKTSKPKAALYINGEYHGLTPLKAAGLLPGGYRVQIVKKGFKTVNIAIQVKDGVSDFYYIEMEADGEALGGPLQGQEAAADVPASQTQSPAVPEL